MRNLKLILLAIFITTSYVGYVSVSSWMSDIDTVVSDRNKQIAAIQNKGSVQGVMIDDSSGEKKVVNITNNKTDGSVLAVQDEVRENSLVFRLPVYFFDLIHAASGKFDELLDVGTDLSVGNDAIIGNNLTVNGQLISDSAELINDLVVGGNIEAVTTNVSGDVIVGGTLVSTGNITAPNITYSIIAGTGITISGTQDVTITNSDPGSAQFIFKNFDINGSTISADNNDDTLTFAPGFGVTLSSSGKTVTVSADPDTLNNSGWNESGTTVSLSTSTNNVGIGTSATGYKLDVVGTTNITGATTLGSSLAVTSNSTIGGSLGVTVNTTVGGTLGITGATTLSGGASVSSGINNNSGGITNAGSITGVTGFTSSGTVTLSNLSMGILHTNVNGVVSTSAVNLANTDVTGTLPFANGGTGLSSILQGDLIYGSGINTVSTLSAGGDGDILQLSGGLPVWSTVAGVGSLCPNCVVDDPGGNQTITPTSSTATGLIVKQALSGSVDVFRVESNDGLTEYFKIDSSGNVVLGNQTSSGVFTVSPANTDPISISPVTQGSNQYTGTITSEDLTTNRTWIFPDVSGVVCMASGNCTGTAASVGGSGTNNYLTKWSDTYAVGNSGIYDNGTNIGIGTTTMTALLDIAGTLNADGNVTFGADLSASGHATISGSLRTDQSVDFNDTLGVSGNTTLGSALDVTGIGTFGGNVGIGVSIPTASLDISGRTIKLSSQDQAYYRQYSGGNTSDAFTIYTNGGAYGSQYAQVGLNDNFNNNAYEGGAIYFDTRSITAPIRFAVKASGGNPTTAMSVAVDGNVGVGTTIPSSKLQIDGGSVKITSGNLLLNDTSITPAVFGSGAMGLDLGFGSSVRMQLRGSDINILSGLDIDNSAADIPALDVRNHSNYSGTNTFQVGIIGGATDFVVASDGNVGIGTTGPLSSVHINGGTGTIETGLTFGDGDTGLYEKSDDVLAIATNNTDRFNLNTTELTSVTSGAALIRHAAGNDSYNTYSFRDDYDTGIRRPLADTLTFQTVGSERIRVDSQGNVGIGTSSPDTKLDVAGNLSVNSIISVWSGAYGVAQIGDGMALWSQIGASDSYISNNSYFTGAAYKAIRNAAASKINLGSQGLIRFQTAPSVVADATQTFSDVMTILNIGNVGINSTSPSQKLDVNGDSIISGELALHGSSVNNSYGLNIGSLSGGQRGVNIVSSAPASQVYGTYFNVDSPSGSSTNYGLYATQTNGGNSDFAGVFVYTTGGKSHGLYTDLSIGSGLYGFGSRNTISGASAEIYGTSSALSGANSTLYGNYNYLTISENGTGYGVFNDINTTNDATAQIGYSNYSVLDTYSGATDALYGSYIVDGGASTGGIQTGLYVDLDDPDVTNYSIFVQNGSGKSYFGSNVGIGTISPTSPLHIKNTNSSGSGDYIANLTDFSQSASGAMTAYAYRAVANATHTSGTLTGLQANSTQGWFTGNGGTTTYGEVLTSFANVTTGASVSNLSMLKIYTPSKTGTISSLVGIDLQNMNQGSSSNYSIYSAGGNMYHAGNIGIASISPGYPLDVNGVIRSSSYMRYNTYLLDENGGDTVFQSLTNDVSGASSFNFSFATGAWAPGTKMTILSNGAVGIGTTSPGAPLHVYGGDNLLRLDHSSATGSPYLDFRQAGTRRGYIQFVDSGNALRYNSEYGEQEWFVSGTQKMTLTADGNLGIGSTSPSEVLDVVGRINVSDGIEGTGHVLRPRDTAAANIIFNKYDGTGNFWFRNTSTVGGNSPYVDLFMISNDGRIYTPSLFGSSSAGSDMRYDTGSKELYYFTSSRRYKDNITPIEIDTSKIYDLKPVSYTATNPIEGREGIREFGMIAEDTYEFIPEIVSWKDGHINSINYSQLPVLLLNEVQKHERKINGINNYLSLDDSGLLSLSTNNTPVVEQQNTFADYISFSNQIASFLKEVVFNVNAKFLASVKFVKQVTFGDEVKFSQDTVGRFVVPSGVLKVKVNFENEFTQVPTVYLSAQNQVEGGYNLEEINLDGFIVIFDIVQSEDVTFDWFAVLGSRTENATIQILEENTFSDQIEDVAGVSTQVTPEPISVPQTLIESTPTPTPELIIEVIQEASVEATISTNSAIVAQ